MTRTAKSPDARGLPGGYETFRRPRGNTRNARIVKKKPQHRSLLLTKTFTRGRRSLVHQVHVLDVFRPDFPPDSVPPRTPRVQQFFEVPRIGHDSR